jgi:hypothetical protein
MIVVLILVLWIAPIILGVYLGSKRDKLAAGILLPLFFGWLGLAIVGCLGNRTTSLVVSQHVIVQNNPEDPAK